MAEIKYVDLKANISLIQNIEGLLFEKIQQLFKPDIDNYPGNKKYLFYEIENLQKKYSSFNIYQS